MYKIILFSSLCLWITACGNEQIAHLQEQRSFKESNPRHENSIIAKEDDVENEKTSFKKCSLKNNTQKIISYNNLHKYDTTKSMVNSIIGEKFFISPESFVEEYTALNFEQNNPCAQLQVSFSNGLLSTIQIYNLIDESEVIKIMENKAISSKVKIDKSFLFVSSSSTPDNISALPEHRFRISMDCESDLEYFCAYRSGPEEKCESSNLRGKFPDGICKIKGSNQIFALYPTGKVVINFEGTLKKIGEGSNGTSELELVFNHVEWR